MTRSEESKIGKAVFSDCDEYRYYLSRKIENQEAITFKRIAFLLLNPSTATAEKNDPTISKCCTYARLWGYSDLTVVNIFAYRSTDPKALAKSDDPVGPENDMHILNVAKSVDMVLCAWGLHGKLHDRGKIVTGMLRQNDIRLYYLELNQDGSPCHPLYKKLDLKPSHWIEADEFGTTVH